MNISQISEVLSLTQQASAEPNVFIDNVLSDPNCLKPLVNTSSQSINFVNESNPECDLDKYLSIPVPKISKYFSSPNNEFNSPSKPKLTYDYQKHELQIISKVLDFEKKPIIQSEIPSETAKKHFNFDFDYTYQKLDPQSLTPIVKRDMTLSSSLDRDMIDLNYYECKRKYKSMPKNYNYGTNKSNETDSKVLQPFNENRTCSLGSFITDIIQ